MKKVQMFRNFLWFPIISITLFNITFKIHDKNYKVPQSHYIILLALILIYIGTFFIDRQSKK
jgi:cell division protein FtsW (lipid II flippase)